MIMSFSALTRSVFTLDGPVSRSLERSGPFPASVCVTSLSCGGQKKTFCPLNVNMCFFLVILRANVDYFPVHN